MRTLLLLAFAFHSATASAQQLAQVLRTEVALPPALALSVPQHALSLEARQQLLQAVLTDVSSGRTKAWSATDASVQLSEVELKAIFNPKVTQFMENPEPPHNLTMVTTEGELDYAMVTALHIYEAWDLDPATGRLNRRLLGICPVMDMYDQTLQKVAPRPIYLIKYEDFKL
jgi:hypothetical protein